MRYTKTFPLKKNSRREKSPYTNFEGGQSPLKSRLWAMLSESKVNPCAARIIHNDRRTIEYNIFMMLLDRKKHTWFILL